MKRYYILHYIGQYLLLLIAFLITYLTYFSDFAIKQKVGPIYVKSKSESKFNSLNPPFIFTHFTDTHVNSFNQKHGEKFEMSLNRSLLYQSDILLHTGDLADNFCTDKRPKYGHQCHEDYLEYTKIHTKYKKYFKTSLVAAGNHDMFGIYSFDSPNFNFLNISRELYDTPMKNYDEFLVSNYKFKLNNFSQFNFVALNPFAFPTVHPTMMYHVHTWRGFIDRLESVVETIPMNEKIIFYSHFPQSSFTSVANPIFPSKSTNGNSIAELIQRRNTIAFLSGHVHPTMATVEHHGEAQIEGEIVSKNCQYLESVGFDIGYKNMFEVATIDNERVVYHPIDPIKSEMCLITYPVPWNQTTSHAFIDDENAFLRIVCFGENKPLKIEIHGDIECKTIEKVKKVKENVYLYEYPLQKLIDDDKKNSKRFVLHDLKFDGDWKGEIKFYSKGIVPSFKEPKNHEYSKVLVVRVSLYFIVIYLVFVTFPFSSTFLKKEEQLYFDFLHKDEKHAESLKFWILTVTGFCLRLKIQRLNNIYKMILFIAVLWPIILPLCLMETEFHFGFIWMYGYFCGGIFRYSEHGQDYAFYYYISIVLPVLLASASLAVNVPFVGIGGIETFVLCFLSVRFVSGFVWFDQLAESAGNVCKYISAFSLGMIVLFPLLFGSYFYLFLVVRKGRDTDLYSEGLTLIHSVSV